jgi:hypothetical protein
MAHSASWGWRISYVWASTQGRQPVSFVTVYIPLRGEQTLNENQPINHSYRLCNPCILQTPLLTQLFNDTAGLSEREAGCSEDRSLGGLGPRRRLRHPE